MKNPKKTQAVSPADRRSADQVRKNCVAELKLFRSNVHQALTSFQFKVEGEIEQMI